MICGLGLGELREGLIEFQSTVDPWMAVRIMTYVGLLYQDLIAAEKLVVGSKLPPVLPVVLYNGDPEWTAATDISQLVVEVPGGLSRYRPHLQLGRWAYAGKLRTYRRGTSLHRLPSAVGFRSEMITTGVNRVFNWLVFGLLLVCLAFSLLPYHKGTSFGRNAHRQRRTVGSKGKVGKT